MEPGREVVCSSIDDVSDVSVDPLSTTGAGTELIVPVKNANQTKTTSPSRETIFDWILDQVDVDRENLKSGCQTKPFNHTADKLSPSKLSTEIDDAAPGTQNTLRQNQTPLTETKAYDPAMTFAYGIPGANAPSRVNSSDSSTGRIDLLFEEISQKLACDESQSGLDGVVKWVVECERSDNLNVDTILGVTQKASEICLQFRDEHLSRQLMQAKALVNQVSGVIAQATASHRRTCHDTKTKSTIVKGSVPTVNAYSEYVQTDETETTSTDDTLPTMRWNQANGRQELGNTHNPFSNGKYDAESSDSVSPIDPMDQAHHAYQRRDDMAGQFAKRQCPSEEKLSWHKKRNENRLWQFFTQNSPLSGRRKLGLQLPGERLFSKSLKSSAQVGEKVYGDRGVSEGKLNIDYDLSSQRVNWPGRAVSHVTLDDWLKSGNDSNLNSSKETQGMFRKMSTSPREDFSDAVVESTSPPPLAARLNNISNISAMIRRKLGKKPSAGSSSNSLKFGPQELVVGNAVTSTQRPLQPSEYRSSESMRCTSLMQLNGWQTQTSDSPTNHGSVQQYFHLYNTRRQNPPAIERYRETGNIGSNDWSKRKMKYIELKREPLSGDVDHDSGIFSLDQHVKWHYE